MAAIMMAGCLSSCEDYADPVMLTPTLTTNTVSADAITRTEATLTGRIKAPNAGIIKSFGFRYSTLASLAESQTVTVNTSANVGDFTYTLTGLSPNTTYYYQTFATGGFNEVVGNTVSFKTSEYEAPSVGATSSSAITESSFTLSSQLLSDGGAGLTALGFLYRESYGTGNIPTPDINDAENWTATHIQNLSSIKIGSSFSQDITGLRDDTEYDVCAFATSMGANSSALTGYGPIIQVRTDRIRMKPEVATPVVTDVTETSANATISVISEGTEKVTKMGVFYTTHAFSQYTSALDGITVVAVGTSEAICVLSGLTPGETYYICSFAENEVGTSYSQATSFTTKLITAPTLGSTSVSDKTENSATFTSSITSDGGAEVTMRGFCYSTTNPNPTRDDTNNTTVVTSNDTETMFSATADNLVGGTSYYVCSFATNSKGTSYGPTDTFSTTKTEMATLSSVEISNITELTATALATIIETGGAEVTQKGFCYSTTTRAPQLSDMSVVSTAEGNTISCELSNLDANTTYYICAFATNKNGTSYGTATSFKTSLYTVPTLGATSVNNITETTADFSSAISTDGGTAITAKGFCFSSSTSNPTLENGEQIQCTTDGNVITATATGLTPGVTYYVRSYATNSKGTAYGDSKDFKTLKIDRPTLGPTSVSDITEHSAHLSSAISDDGGSAITVKGFCYSKTESQPNLGNSTTITSDAAGNMISADLTNLTQGAKYYVCSYATNDKGTSYGDVTSFVCSTSILQPSVSDVTVVGESGTELELSAVVTSNGNGNITVKGFVYLKGDSGVPDLSDNVKNDIDPGDNIYAVLKELTPNTWYSIRAYATNEAGTSYSENTLRIRTKLGGPDEGDVVFPNI